MDSKLAINKKASYNYHIVEKFEAGIALTGSEVKSCREKQVSLSEGYIKVEKNKACLVNVHIAEYNKAFYNNHHPLRERQLLLHKKEIKQLAIAIDKKGMTVIPLKMYLKKGFVKLSLATVKGKKMVDKRQNLKEKDEKLKINRLLKNR